MIPSRFKFDLRSHPNFFSNAKRFFIKDFTLFYQKNQKSLELVVVVPKKTVSLATGRNQLKRKVYAALLPILKQRNASPYSIVLVPKATTVEFSVEQIREKLRSALQQIL